MKKSKSLLAVHFSGNSIQESTKNKMIEKLAQTSDKSAISEITKFPNKDSTLMKIGSLLKNLEVSSITSKQPRDDEQQKKLDLYRQNLEIKMGLDGDRKKKYETVDDRIVFYRFLGHLEINNGHMWKLGDR
jgi:hypothetical protein